MRPAYNVFICGVCERDLQYFRGLLDWDASAPRHAFA